MLIVSPSIPIIEIMHIILLKLIVPITVIRKATTYEIDPIQKMHIANVRNRKRGNRRESGILSHKTVVIGQRRINPQ